jgi:hypothetical protein
VRGEACLESLDERISSGRTLSVTLHDVGRTGCMLLSDGIIEPGTMWRLRLHDRGQFVASQPLVVRWCRKHGEGYRLGAQFILEPYILKFLGVSEAEVTADELAQEFASYAEPSRANAAAMA